MRMIALVLLAAGLAGAQEKDSDGFVSLFNGKDLSGWKAPEGDNGHWKVVDGVIDYDALSESREKDKNLWSEKEYGDFVLRLDWRIKETGFMNPKVPVILPDGSHKLDADGKEIRQTIPDSDSGVLLRRRDQKAQLNIWCWPIGSGEVYGYRMDNKLPPEVRAGVTPKKKADRPVGEWNTFEVTLKGNVLTVVLNGETVIEGASLPDLPERGPIGLQHHGTKNAAGQWINAPSLVQFRNLRIKELP